MAAFSQAGFSPNWTVQADEYWSAQGFVAAGLGVALIPSLSLRLLWFVGCTTITLPYVMCGP